MVYYEKRGSVVYTAKDYVYEVTVNAYSKNYFIQVDSRIYFSKVLLKHVETYFPNRHVEIACELIGAPLEYLESEGYKIFNYVKKKRKR